MAIFVTIIIFELFSFVFYVFVSFFSPGTDSCCTHITYIYKNVWNDEEERSAKHTNSNRLTCSLCVLYGTQCTAFHQLFGQYMWMHERTHRSQKYFSHNFFLSLPLFSLSLSLSLSLPAFENRSFNLVGNYESWTGTIMEFWVVDFIFVFFFLLLFVPYSCLFFLYSPFGCYMRASVAAGTLLHLHLGCVCVYR